MQTRHYDTGTHRPHPLSDNLHSCYTQFCFTSSQPFFQYLSYTPYKIQEMNHLEQMRLHIFWRTKNIFGRYKAYFLKDMYACTNDRLRREATKCRQNSDSGHKGKKSGAMLTVTRGIRIFATQTCITLLNYNLNTQTLC